jgi:hypothetical protein
MLCTPNDIIESLRALRCYIICVTNNIYKPTLSEIFLETQRLWYFGMRYHVVCYMTSDVTGLFSIITPPVSRIACIPNILF